MTAATVQLNDGNEMPAMAFGTGSKWKGQDVTDYVSQALESGFSHIDSAQWYRTEDCVGRAIHESGLSRSDLFLTTKWSGLSTVPEAIQNSLKSFGVEQVDLYLIHNPSAITDLEATWREFETIKKDGLAKSIGVSNFDLKLMRDLLKIAHVKPAVNQILFHPYNYAQMKDLVEFSAEHGIVTEAYSSLQPITMYPGGPVDAPVAAAAKRLGASPTQVLLAWVRSKGVAIVTTSSNKGRLQEYLAVADLPPLTEEEIAMIDEAGAKGPPQRSLLRLSKAECTRLFKVAIMLVQLAFFARFVYRWLYVWH